MQNFMQIPNLESEMGAAIHFFGVLAKQYDYCLFFRLMSNILGFLPSGYRELGFGIFDLKNQEIRVWDF